MNLASGIAVLRDTVYAINLGTMFSFNTMTGNDAGVTRSTFGVGPLQAPTTVATWGKQLVLMSGLTGSLMVWDPKAGAPVFTTEAGLPVDAQPFQGDLIWTETATGNVVRGSGPELADREILGTFDGPTGLAATKDDLYVSVVGTGEVLRLIANGELLETPELVAGGFKIPEGLALHRANTRLLVVDGGTQTLEEIYLKSGNVRTIATDLGFSPAIPGVGAFGWFNNIEVDRRGHMFVNGDGANVIWKIQRVNKKGGKRPDELVYKGRESGTAEIIGCDDGQPILTCEATTAGMATVTSLGKTTSSSTATFEIDTASSCLLLDGVTQGTVLIASGKGIHHLAGGSEVHIDFESTLCTGEGDGSFEGTQTITGGKGRFAGATGSAVVTGSNGPDGFAISYVGTITKADKHGTRGKSSQRGKKGHKGHRAAKDERKHAQHRHRW